MSVLLEEEEEEEASYVWKLLEEEEEEEAVTSRSGIEEKDSLSGEEGKKCDENGRQQQKQPRHSLK